jgi:hypothetical protein
MIRNQVVGVGLAIGAGLAPLSFLGATAFDDAPPFIGAGVRSRRCARLRLAPRISTGRPSVLLSAATSLWVLSPDRRGGSGATKALRCLSASSVPGG